MFGSSLDYTLKPCLSPTPCPTNKGGTSVQEDQLNHAFWSLHPKLPETTVTDTIVLADWIKVSGLEEEGTIEVEEEVTGNGCGKGQIGEERSRSVQNSVLKHDLVKSSSWEATVRQKLCLPSSYTISRLSIDGKEVEVVEPSW